jgi:predicted DNA-binding ribbon-helix-helix protein
MIRKHRIAGSRVRKRSINMGGRMTSVTLEEEFWQALKGIAFVRQLPINLLVADIDEHRRYANLSSAIRLFVLDFFQNETDELATWRKARTR